MKGQLLESSGTNGLCYIDLPLNSNQAATRFEWKLRIIKIGHREEQETHRNYNYARGRYVNEIKTRLIDNDIKIGFSNLQQHLFISTKSGSLQLTGSETAFKRPEKNGPIVNYGDILLFEFDCTTGTFFVQKNDECRTLLGYVNDLKSLQTKTFYPCVRLEREGDTIEILSAGPIFNSIHSTPIPISKSYLNIISTLYLRLIKTKTYLKSLHEIYDLKKVTVFILCCAYIFRCIYTYIW